MTRRNDNASPRFRPSLTQLEARETPASLFPVFGAAPGGVPLVEVQRPNGSVLARFEAFETSFRGGVRAAAGELDGDASTVEVVATSGPGGGPRVRVFSVNTVTGAVRTTDDFFAFEPSFRDGVRVAVGRVFDDPNLVNPRLARDQIILGTDAGGGPRVRVLDLGNPVADFFAFEPEFRGGVRVAAGDVDGNPANGEELVVAAGPGGGPRVRAIRLDGSVVSDDFASPPEVNTGVNVSVVNGRVVTDTLSEDVSQRNAVLNALALALVAPPAAPDTSDDFTFSFAPGQVTAPGTAALAVGVPGVVFSTPATTPGLFSSAATAPGLFGSATTAGVAFGSAATAPGVFSSAATAPGVFSSAVTAPGVFSTPTTAAVTFSTPATSPGLFSSAATAPGLFSSTTTAGIPIGTAATAPGVFGGVTTGGTGF
jgi:hypothetical protein